MSITTFFDESGQRLGHVQGDQTFPAGMRVEVEGRRFRVLYTEAVVDFGEHLTSFRVQLAELRVERVPGREGVTLTSAPVSAEALQEGVDALAESLRPPERHKDGSTCRDPTCRRDHFIRPHWPLERIRAALKTNPEPFENYARRHGIEGGE